MQNSARITIAPGSSRIASVSRKTLSDGGTRPPTSAITPSAKAMSVAAGIAKSFSVSGLLQLSAT